MENREPKIGEGSLIAGTTTSKKVGCPLYPEGSAVIIWNELITMPHRNIQSLRHLRRNPRTPP